MIKLYQHQKLAIKFATNTHFTFIEAPTGSGKSVMISYLAHYYRNKNKKVIVSTHTNQLALELLNAIKENEIEGIETKKSNIDIVVGKNNYLDIDNLDLSLLTQFVNAEEVIQELNNLTQTSNPNKEYLIDIFLNKLDIDEEAKELLSKLLANNRDKEYIKDFSDLSISVTNHYYLIYKLLFSKEDLKDYVFILDEVHLINEAMETIFTHSFSLFRFRYLLNKIINEIKFLEFRGQKSLLKGLLKLQNFTDTLFKETVSEKLTGLSFINDEKQIKIIKRIIRTLTKDDFLKIKQKLEKSSIIKIEHLKKIFLDEWNELLKISNVNEKDIAIYYSPAKGYPRLSVLSGEYYPNLKTFWNKMNEVKAFSATLTIPDNDDYYKKRLNIQKEVDFLKLDPVFKLNQINYLIVDKSFPKPNTTEDSVDLEWVKAIGDFIVKTHNGKNSLVLMGGFLEVDNLYDYLTQLGLETNILKAEKKKSAYRIIERFKKQGGILIATRNYGTGVDLKGGLLEKLYITKLPYPVLGTKKWIELIKRDKLRGTNISHFLMINEMLLNLKQWIGRLIRTPEDKGDLYILDSRVNKINIRPKVERVIKDSFKEF